MKIVSVEEMQKIEKDADSSGLSYEQMMGNAGAGITDWLITHVNVHQGIVGLVGSGNNGGDTLIALTGLSHRGIRTVACLVKKRTGDALLEAYEKSGGIVVDLYGHQPLDPLEAALDEGMILLDGILGTGLRLPIRGDLADVVARISKTVQKRSRSLKIAIDCPSGLDCDVGDVADVTIPADFTLCMAAIKIGLLEQPGRSFCGMFQLIDIGLSEETKQLMDGLPEMVEQSFVSKHMPDRQESGHKGTFGTCQVVAGSHAFTGAAYLAGKAAYLSGCGLVNIGSVADVKQSLSGALIEAIWTILPDVEGAYSENGVVSLKHALFKADALVLGPGLGFFHENVKFLAKLMQVIPAELPTVIDADGLNLIGEIDNWWDLLPENTILTPHPGEMSKLTGLSVDEIQRNRWLITQDFAKKWGVVLVLKGAMTVIGTPVGELFIIPVSDSALATAGSGDVLSGLIGGLLAQGISGGIAAICGAWLHAQAGLIAREWVGTANCVTAINILDCLPEAFTEI